MNEKQLLDHLSSYTPSTQKKTQFKKAVEDV